MGGTFTRNRVKNLYLFFMRNVILIQKISIDKKLKISQSNFLRELTFLLSNLV
jgi:hypothetical protein